MKRSLFHAASLAVAVAAASSALAGGPIQIFDAASHTPYRWPAGITPVRTDVNGLGVVGGSPFLDNALVTSKVQAGIDQWSSVPTSTFHGQLVGDLGYTVDASNVLDVLSTWNGGGIHVVYDQDGSIHDALFGPYSGVLGFTVNEWVSDSGPWIEEATVILNGAVIPTWTTPDDAAAQYAGVITHELGHAIGLAHSQTNGQLYFYLEGYSGPEGCATPWSWSPFLDSIPASQVETMYPFCDLATSGPTQATVDLLDDRNALSDLYPSPSWAGTPAIRGTISAPTKNPKGMPYTGANVIARNVADPFGDAVSALSGDHSQGLAGPDGTYRFGGLTPGASYALYVDNILAGAFSTPVQSVLPGPEEWWNGKLESGDGVKDDRCAYTAIAPKAGTPSVADVQLNRVKNAPTFTAIDLPSSAITSLSGDGSVAAGAWAAGHIRWTAKTGPVDIGGSWQTPQPAISDDGKTIAGTVEQGGALVAGLWTLGAGWTALGGFAGATPCDGDLSSGWGVSNGKTVVGLGWHDCTLVHGFSVKPGGAMRSLGDLGDNDFESSRADAVSADGKLIVGWDRDSFGFWRGVRWDDGVESLFRLAQPATCGDPGSGFDQVFDVGTAQGLNGAGSAVVGEGFPLERSYDDGMGNVYHWCDGGAWLWTRRGGVQSLGEAPYPDFNLAGSDVSDDANVVTGILTPIFWDFGTPHGMIWTPSTGALDFQEFLAAQGTYAPGWLLYSVPALSGDGHTAGGAGFSAFGQQGFIVQMPKVIVCHHQVTLDVSFPDALPDHMAHGDTIGICGNGM